MRVLIGVLIFMFAVAILGVMLMNTSETVNVRLWVDPDREYRDIPLGWVLFVATFAGIVFMGLLAVIEGMKTRLDNARLTRQVRKLQREIDSLRAPPLPPDSELEDDPRDVETLSPAGPAGRGGPASPGAFGI